MAGWSALPARPDRRVIAALCIAGALLFGGGIGVGVAVTRSKTERILAEQTSLIGAVQDGQQAILESQQALVEVASRPITIDAELRSELARVPVQCLTDLGGSPLSVQCAWASCAAYGQSAANRPECSALTALLVETLSESGADDQR